MIFTMGEFIALFVAFLWGLASIIWTRVGKTIPSLELNLIKAVLASALMLLAIVFSGQIRSAVPINSALLLAFSGAIGIAVGDTALFESFQKIGPTRAQLLKLLSPPLVSLAALASLHERLSFSMLGGMLITVLGILLVMSERLPHDRMDRRTFWEGIGLGLFSTLAEVVGVVVSRGVLARTSIEPSWSALLRLASAAVAAWILMGLTRQKIGKWSRDGCLLGLPNGVANGPHPRFDARQQLGLLIAAGVFSGTFIGVWLQQAALKVTEAGVAQTLFATSPLFILVLLAILQRKLPSLRAFSGVVIAIGGVALLFFG